MCLNSWKTVYALLGPCYHFSGPYYPARCDLIDIYKMHPVRDNTAYKKEEA